MQIRKYTDCFCRFQGAYDKITWAVVDTNSFTFPPDFAHIKIKPVYLKSPKAFQLLDYGDKSERQT